MPITRPTFKPGIIGPSPNDPRTLKLEKYVLKAELPPIPAENTWQDKVKSWGGYLGNDKVGDCTVAGAGHKETLDMACNGQEFIPDTQEILDTYFKLTGGEDTGLPLLTVLNWWRKNGICGHKIGAFVQVNLQEEFLIRAAMFLFGGMYSGMMVPEPAMKQVVWDVTPGQPKILGGHCVLLTDYHRWGYMCCTWGEDQPMTRPFFQKYFFEGWAVLSEDWIQGGDSPQGFKKDELLADLQKIEEAGKS